MTEGNVMIELKNVCKNYGMTQALNDVSFTVQKGQIVGFVGPNGAGKSTAMRIHGADIGHGQRRRLRCDGESDRSL
jgi:ABC-type multidrug transport system ATPase subunit